MSKVALVGCVAAHLVAIISAIFTIFEEDPTELTLLWVKYFGFYFMGLHFGKELMNDTNR